MGHRKPIQEWSVLIKDHHPGYISWEQFERNQKILSENNFMRTGSTRKAGRGGHGLLTAFCGAAGVAACFTPITVGEAISYVTCAED